MRPIRPIVRPRQSDIDRFWKFVNRRGPHDCWEWTGALVDKSDPLNYYGVFWLDGSNIRAHRFAYYLHYGVDPGDARVLHRCDNPKCVNWAHLFTGTVGDNQADMAAKGRSVLGRSFPGAFRLRGDAHPARTHPERLARGSQHGNARISESYIPVILDRYQSGEPLATIAADYKVSSTQIINIVEGKAWRHISMGRTVPLRSKQGHWTKIHPELVPRGSRAGGAKLTAEDVLAIRAAHASGERQVNLARRYGVRQTNISEIVNRHTWKHI